MYNKKRAKFLLFPSRIGENNLRPFEKANNTQFHLPNLIYVSVLTFQLRPYVMIDSVVK